MGSPGEKIDLSSELLWRLQPLWDGPWLCCGDFNEVLAQDEHCGPRDWYEAQISAFRDCLMDCSLTNLGYSGPKFTWCNKQDPDCHVKCQLDRAMANGAFTALFDDCGVENLIATTSDHYSMLFQLGGRVQQDR